jgi:hypothetical protein
MYINPSRYCGLSTPINGCTPDYAGGEFRPGGRKTYSGHSPTGRLTGWMQSQSASDTGTAAVDPKRPYGVSKPVGLSNRGVGKPLYGAWHLDTDFEPHW